MTKPSPLGHEKRWLGLGVLCLALFVVGADNTILSTALPTLARQFHASTGDLQWVVDSYAVVFAGLLITAGALGDRLGRKGAFMAGMVVFTAGSVVAAFASGTGGLVMARCVMGAGAAFVMPATLSLVTNLFPPAERQKAIGIWAGVSGLSLAAGPLLGGWLLQTFWWGAAFLVNLPIAVVALAAGARLLPTSRTSSRSGFDWLGTLLSMLGMSSLVYSLIEAGTRGPGDPAVLASAGVAVGAGVAFVAWELHSSAPLVDVRLFKQRAFAAANLSVALVEFALFGASFVLTQYLQLGLGASPAGAGALLLPVAFALFVASSQSARVVRRLGVRATVATGLAVVAAGLAWVATIGPASGLLPFVGSTVLIGLGMGVAITPATDTILGSVPPEHAGVASALNDTVIELGGGLGVGILGSMLAASFRAGMESVAAGLPPRLGTAATASFGAAIDVAEQVGGRAGAELRDTAQVAFTSGMSMAMSVGTVVALVGVLVAARFLPRRPVPEGAKPEASARRAAPAGRAAAAAATSRP